ncbi:MAG: ABC transporter substrate-binding protein [Candidatus ainarchaeum sp.]|nr:ABC transporter substrate-binding protein [Candidatus ainarchaeum sp.]
MKLKIAIFALLIFLIIFLFGCTQPENSQKIKIGFIGPLSGGPALWGQGSLNMINLAVGEINSQGGINGKTLELIAEDGKCSSEGAVSAAQKLIDIDGVKFIFGGHCSPETVAIVPIIDKAKVFLLAGVTSTDDAVSGSKYAFRTSPPTLDQAKITSETAYYKYVYKNIALITEEASYSKSFSEDIKKTFQGTIVEEFSYNPGEIDFKSGLLKIKEKNPDAIWISPQDPNEAVLLLKQMKELDLLNIPLFGNTVFVSKQVYEQSEKLLPETAFAITLFADPSAPNLLEVQQKYKEKYGADVPYNLYYVSAAYDGVYMLKNALMQCGEDVDCVQKYFENIKDYQGVAGTFTFKQNGDPIFNSWKEMKIKDGTTILD